MSHFDSAAVAAGYSADRPYFHPEVMSRVWEVTGFCGRLPRALDVGCGAGLSSIALVELADRVVGVDCSRSMIRSAIRHPQVTYCTCRAEEIPFRTGFDLITLAGSVNWIDRSRFLTEARRLLPVSGYVVVYDNTIRGKMDGDEGFSRWYTEGYLRRYPKPPRDESPITAAEATTYGFAFVHAQDYSNSVEFTLERFVAYLITQSNVTAALAAGDGGGQRARAWLTASLRWFFAGGARRLEFGGYIWYLRRL